MKEKIITFLAIVVWISIFILMIKFAEMENKFWFGFLCGTLATLTIGGVIIVIIQQEKRQK